MALTSNRGRTRIDDELVRGWIDRYLAAWRSNDRAKIEALFTADASYRPHPDAELAVGRAAIADAWLESADGRHLDVRAGTHVVHDDIAIITGWTDYADGERFLNLWIVRFDDDGRCADFTEWWMTRRRG